MRYQCPFIALCVSFCICVLVFFSPFISIRSNKHNTENNKQRKEANTKSRENGKVNIIFTFMLKYNMNASECKLLLIEIVQMYNAEVVKKTRCIKWYVKSKPKIVRQGAILHTLVNRLLFTPTYDHLFFD